MIELAATCAHYASGGPTEYPCSRCGDSGYELTAEGYEIRNFLVALLADAEFKGKAREFVQDIATTVSTLEGRIDSRERGEVG